MSTQTCSGVTQKRSNFRKSRAKTREGHEGRDERWILCQVIDCHRAFRVFLKACLTPFMQWWSPSHVAKASADFSPISVISEAFHSILSIPCIWLAGRPASAERLLNWFLCLQELWCVLWSVHPITCSSFGTICVHFGSLVIVDHVSMYP